MTILYRPVKIVSAEQAEALPVRTPIIIGPFVAMRSDSESFWGMSFTDGDYSSSELVRSFPDYDLVALVPIEAEEETRGGPLDNDWDWDNGPASPPRPTPATRLVTPWQVADA